MSENRKFQCRDCKYEDIFTEFSKGVLTVIQCPKCSSRNVKV